MNRIRGMKSNWQDVFRGLGIETTNFAQSDRNPRFESTYKWTIRASIPLLYILVANSISI